MSPDDPGCMPFAVVDVVCKTALSTADLVADLVSRSDVAHAYFAAGILLLLREHDDVGVAAKMRALADTLERGERPAGMAN